MPEKGGTGGRAATQMIRGSGSRDWLIGWVALLRVNSRLPTEDVSVTYASCEVKFEIEPTKHGFKALFPGERSHCIA